ncbi:alpha/beta fold hydrolase [Vagococcus lutrae]|uniref:alpha/beta fold hydrolase n=1 Tax=Vagococcus lutrae TaxID=81947 RepID=UPI00288ECDA6|nr:alpha/beta fold hydrolase [Vagococcus lutrae]MDT2842742.1 alpha/beta fold hydrolase [Vagococcus lutrae]
MKDVMKRSIGTAIGMTAGLLIYDQIKKSRSYQRLVIGQTREKKIPTLLLHGVHGDRRTMQGMIRRWGREGLAYKALQIEVSADGDMIVNGTWNQNPDNLNPLIQVFFENNDASADQQAKWLTRIMVFLKDKLEIDRLYLLGHSMGGVASMYYLTSEAATTDDTPIVKKFVSLGSPYKGEIADTLISRLYQLEKEGKRDFDEMYQHFMSVNQRLSPNLSVLNIYGDLEDGTESDGIIMTEDARALRDIVAHKVASYDEVEITGLGGQHTLLHENGEVDETVSLFLWGQ